MPDNTSDWPEPLTESQILDGVLDKLTQWKHYLTSETYVTESSNVKNVSDSLTLIIKYAQKCREYGEYRKEMNESANNAQDLG